MISTPAALMRRRARPDLRSAWHRCWPSWIRGAPHRVRPEAAELIFKLGDMWPVALWSGRNVAAYAAQLHSSCSTWRRNRSRSISWSSCLTGAAAAAPPAPSPAPAGDRAAVSTAQGRSTPPMVVPLTTPPLRRSPIPAAPPAAAVAAVAIVAGAGRGRFGHKLVIRRRSLRDLELRDRGGGGVRFLAHSAGRTRRCWRDEQRWAQAEQRRPP